MLVSTRMLFLFSYPVKTTELAPSQLPPQLFLVREGFLVLFFFEGGGKMSASYLSLTKSTHINRR